MNRILVNISNHPSSKWGEKQKTGWDEIIDIPFPQVSPYANSDEISAMALEYFNNFIKKHYKGRASSPEKSREIISRFLEQYDFHIAGEFTFAYYLTEILREYGASVVVATTERKTVEQVAEDGSTVKTSIFEFVQWREIDTSTLKFIELVDYQPKYDELYLKALREKAKKSWLSSIDPDQWLNEIRGRYDT